jgi:hypothetical protein
MDKNASRDWYEEEEFWDYFLPVIVARDDPGEVSTQVDQIVTAWSW